MITYGNKYVEMELGKLILKYEAEMFTIKNGDTKIYELSKDEIEQLCDVDSAELLLPEQYLMAGMAFYIYSNLPTPT